MTTRFIYLSDTHLGARPGVGYVQQPRYTQKLGYLLQLLDSWIADRAPDVAFILHGGDMVDDAGADAIRAAREAFSLRVPVYLSLGNHDMTRSTALNSWLDLAPDFFPDSRPAYSLEGPDWMLHIVPTHWCDTPYLWERSQRPHLQDDDLQALEAKLRRHPEKAHHLCTHGEVLAVPAAQVGRDEAYHPPLPSFSAMMESLTDRYPQLVGILNGHSHINTVGRLDAATVVTVSAFSETPFEFKVIDIGDGVFRMETVALLPSVEFRAQYDWDRTFVQGRACDRTFGD